MALADALSVIGWRTAPVSLTVAAVMMLVGLAVEYWLGGRRLWE
jgi:hypothetical protein